MVRQRLRRLVDRRHVDSLWTRLQREGIVSAGVGTYGHELIDIPEFRLPNGEWVGSRLRLGNYCSIAPCQIFLGGNHHYEYMSQYPFRSAWGLDGRRGDAYNNGDVVVGSDVWFGWGCTVMSGVSIGHGAVVAAKAVVTKDVRPFAIVAGNPAREVRRRFGDAQVEQILQLAWWDWPESRIRSELEDLMSEPHE